MMAEMRRGRDLARMANGPTDLSGFKEHVNHKPPEAAPKEDSDDDDSWDESVDSDDEAFQRYKLQRIQAVQSTLPSFGAHERIMSNTELSAVVKKVHELSYVLVHIYENRVPTCTALNLVMESLAPQFPHIRFCRIRASDAMKGFDIAGCPTLMVYRGGKPVKTFIRLQDTLQGEITDLKLARFLSGKKEESAHPPSPNCRASVHCFRSPGGPCGLGESRGDFAMHETPQLNPPPPPAEGILAMPGEGLFDNVKNPFKEKEGGNSIRTSRQGYHSDDEDY